MMRYCLWLFLGCSITLTAIAGEKVQHFKTQNGTRVQVVELFTSQGCSNCPPADNWLGNFRQDPSLWQSLFPMAWHVDYWDSLGWPDQFARADFSRRQYRYFYNGQSSSVYTPQIFVDGREWKGLIGHKVPTLPSPSLLISEDFDARVEHNHLAAIGTGVLHMAMIKSHYRQTVYRGENAGHRLEQAFIVIGYGSVASNAGQWNTSLPVTHEDMDADALILWVTQDGEPRAIAGGWLKK